MIVCARPDRPAADRLSASLAASLGVRVVITDETFAAPGPTAALLLLSPAALADDLFRGGTVQIRSQRGAGPVAWLSLEPVPLLDGGGRDLLDPGWAELADDEGPAGVLRWLREAAGGEGQPWSAPPTGSPDGSHEHHEHDGQEQEAAGESLVASRSIGGGRYVLLEEIGRGGMGIVYSGWDREHDRRVAIKTMRRLGIPTRARFKEEFQSAANLHHQNLIQAYDLVDDGGRLYIVMEFVEGMAFDEYVDAHPDELRERLAELIAGVQALHDAGYLHLDIKPGNVMVDRCGRAVLLDFGLARFAGTGRGEPAAGGTPAYMAPERSRRQSASPASDWYSVGVILHRCLTGHLELPEAAAGRRSIAVRPWFGEGQADLVECCLRLLDPDPARRPTGRALLSVLRREQARAPHPPWPLGFAGRRPELEALQQAFRDLRHGRSSCWWITGPPGIGKSALMDRFVAGIEALEEGRPLVVRTRCHEREAIPFKAFDRLADALITWAARPAGAEPPLPLGDISLPDLTALFPMARVLEQQQQPATGSTPGTPGRGSLAEQRSRSFEAFRRLALAVSARNPVLLAVDDIDHADRDSAALFADLFRSPAPHIMVVATARSTGPAGGVFFQELGHRAPGRLAVPTRELPLAGLTLADVTELLAATGGSAMAAQLLAESQGNPGFLEGLYSHWWTRTRGASRPGPITWDAALEARLEELPADLRQILEVVAVAGKPIAQAIVMAAAGGQVNPLAGGHALASKRLLKIEGTRRRDAFQCYHDRLRDAVVRRMAPEAVRSCHLRIARELERASSDDLEALAYHFHGAGQTERACHHALQAATRAERALAFDLAAAFYQRVLDWLPAAAPERQGLLVKKARCESSCGRNAAAAQDYSAALALAAGTERAALRQAAAEQLLLGGRVDAGLNQLAPLLRRYRVHLPRFALRWRTALLAVRLWLRGLGFAERPEGRVPPALLAQADLCAMAARGLVAVDFERGAWFAASALRYALDCGDRLRIARALSLAAAILRPLHSAWGRTLLEAAERTAGEQRSGPIAGTLAVVRGHLQILDGDWRAALERCQEGETLLAAQPAIPAWERNIGRMGILRALEELGLFAPVRGHAQEWLNDALDRGDNYAEVTFALFCGMAELVAGFPAAAAALHDRALARWQQRRYTVQHMYATRLRAACHLYQGSPAAAWSAVSTDWPRIKRAALLALPITRLDALLLRGRVAVAAAEAGRREGLPVARRCATLLGRTGRGDAVAASQVLKAALAWGAAEAARAAGLLEEAARRYRTCGMQSMGALVDLRRTRLPGGDRRPSTIQDLTSTLQGRGVGDPARLAEVLTPGFSRQEWNAR